MRYGFILCCAAMLALSALVEPVSAGLNGKMARFTGGTGVSIPEQAPGWLRTDRDSTLVFVVDDDNSLQIVLLYTAIREIEYGQEVSRRIALAIALRSKLPLLSKSRRHFLTIEYADASGAPQAIVFELGKDIVRPIIAVLEAKTGKRVVPQDDEARKMIGKRKD